jgi:hypothetical protein
MAANDTWRELMPHVKAAYESLLREADAHKNDVLKRQSRKLGQELLDVFHPPRATVAPVHERTTNGGLPGAGRCRQGRGGGEEGRGSGGSSRSRRWTETDPMTPEAGSTSQSVAAATDQAAAALKRATETAETLRQRSDLAGKVLATVGSTIRPLRKKGSSSLLGKQTLQHPHHREPPQVGTAGSGEGRGQAGSWP